MPIRALHQCPGKLLLSFSSGLLLLVCTGCSGINASRSFSPLDFFLPGLVENQGNKAATPQRVVGATNVLELAARGPNN